MQRTQAFGSCEKLRARTDFIAYKSDNIIHCCVVSDVLCATYQLYFTNTGSKIDRQGQTDNRIGKNKQEIIGLRPYAHNNKT